MIGFINKIIYFFKKVYGEWEIKGKLTHLKIIYNMERFVVPKISFLTIRKQKKSIYFLNKKF